MRQQCLDVFELLLVVITIIALRLPASVAAAIEAKSSDKTAAWLMSPGVLAVNTLAQLTLKKLFPINSRKGINPPLPR